MFFLPIYALYLQHDLFTALNVAIILSVRTFSGMLFEIPLGAFADLFGRKKTLMLSGFVSVIALIFLSIGGSILIFIIYAILLALARSLLNGTDTALLYDSLKIMRRETNFQKIISINNGAWQTGAAIGSLVGGVLAAVSLRLPVYYTFIPYTLAFIVTFFILEPPYKKEIHRNVFLHMHNTAKLLVRNGLLTLFFATILLFAFSEISFNFNSIFLNFKQIPLIYFGIVFALCFGLGFLSSFVSSHYLNKKFGDKKMLLVSIIMSPLMIVLATLSSGVTCIMFVILSSIFFNIRLPIIMDLYNKKTPSKNRATMLSCVSFGSTLGMALYAPMFGYMVDLYNISTAMQWTALFTVVAIVLVLFVKEK
jgi:MFS family permease